MPVAACAIIKDEYPHYLREWLEWHLPLFDRVVIYNNGSPKMEGVPEGTEGKLEITHFPGKLRQYPSYNHMIRRGREFAWIFFLDGDEFIREFNPRETGNRMSPNVGSVSLNWKTYDFCGLEKADSRRQSEKFLTPVPDSPCNLYVKSMVRPTAVQVWTNAHVPQLKKGFRMIHANGNPISGAYVEPDFRFGYIDHYFTRSREEWESKCRRGKADLATPRKLNEFARVYPGTPFADWAEKRKCRNPLVPLPSS